ncbi:MAG: VCBS repeat-containing protein, partial [Candidatus Thorarchaeota archaeon]
MRERWMRITLAFLLVFLVTSPPLLFGAAQANDGRNIDSDDDGISDWDESNRYLSDPENSDSDEDGIDDGREVSVGTSPIDTDSDGDSFPDTFEYTMWNPEAPIPQCYFRCPYIADLPQLSVNVADDRVVKHLEFTKGGNVHQTTTESRLTSAATGHDWTAGFELGASAWWEYSQEIGASVKVGNEAEIEAHWGVNSQWGLRFEAQASYGHEWTGTHLQQLDIADEEVVEQYYEANWDYSTATILFNVELSNGYSRVVQLDSITFNLKVGYNTYRSETWEPGLILGLGETYSGVVAFELGGEEWIRDITYGGMDLEVEKNSVQFSVYDEGAEDYISSQLMREHVSTRCVVVYIPNTPWGSIRQYVTAHVDKIDGLNVIEALDRLCIPYDYRYGRLMELANEPSRPGEQVWTFTYWGVWHDSTSIVEELSFVDLFMYGRGALLLSLERDSDGDWLTDRDEQRLGTMVDDPDTDDDYADDYVELVLLRSNPFSADTDEGGTIDGIEYYEQMDVHDPLDDFLELPDWYLNHQTIRYAQEAADYLLDRALQPDVDQLTWLAPQSPSTIETINYEGIVSYVTNETIGMGIDESILCIDVGDVDFDSENEVVVGTAPLGKIVVFDYEDDHWSVLTAVTFTKLYGVEQVKVWDISIEDANNNPGDGHEIVVGTYYLDGSDTGNVHLLTRQASNWTITDIDSSIDGGVYSVEVGDVDNDGDNEIVVGQGGTEDLQNCNVSVYEQGGSVWAPTVVATTESSKVHVTIGDLFFTSGGHKRVIAYCSYALNSTIGYAIYEMFQWSNTTIQTNTILAGDIPPWDLFMCVEIGDPDHNGENELVVAIDSTTNEDDGIYIYPMKAPTFTEIVGSLQFVCPSIVVDDFDNDDWDEIVFHTQDVTHFPIT